MLFYAAKDLLLGETISVHGRPYVVPSFFFFYRVSYRFFLSAVSRTDRRRRSLSFRFILIDCDEFTRNFYRKHYDIVDFSPIQLSY